MVGAPPPVILFLFSHKPPVFWGVADLTRMADWRESVGFHSNFIGMEGQIKRQNESFPSMFLPTPDQWSFQLPINDHSNSMTNDHCSWSEWMLQVTDGEKIRVWFLMGVIKCIFDGCTVLAIKGISRIATREFFLWQKKNFFPLHLFSLKIWLQACFSHRKR